MKGKLLTVTGILLMVAGVGTICTTQVLEDMGKIGNAAAVLLKIVGVLCVVGVVPCVYVYLGRLVKEDEELQREEQDERNQMIRGKAAQNTVLLMTVLMLFVELLFICLSYVMPALVVGIAVYISVQAQVLLISYYQKKY